MNEPNLPDSSPSNGNGDLALRTYLGEVARVPGLTPTGERILVHDLEARRAHLRRLVFETGIGLQSVTRILSRSGNGSGPLHDLLAPGTSREERSRFEGALPRILVRIEGRLERARGLLARAMDLPEIDDAIRAALRTPARLLARLRFGIRTLDAITREITKAATRLANEPDPASRHEEQLRALATAAGLRRHLAEIDHARRALADARQDLCVRHLRVVLPIAKRFGHKGIPLLDLIQEGNAALIQAADRYNPDQGCMFRQFARTRVRDAVRKFVSDRSRLIRGSDRDPVSLHEPLDDSEDVSLADRLEDPNAPDPLERLEEELLRARIDGALRRLSIRERNVLRLRFGLGKGRPHSLEEVAQIFRVSKKRIRRMQIEAIRKLALPENRRELEAFLPPDRYNGRN